MEGIPVQINERLGISGMTMIELIVAIAVASIVTLISFAVYTGVARTFHTKQKDADALSELILNRKKIAAVCELFATLDRCYEREATLINDNDSAITFRFTGNALTLNNEVFIDSVKEFAFSVKALKNQRDKTQLLFWSGFYGENRLWFGGCTRVVGK
jgi:prepilin-type N-terminal cleavage/methylation domain-containing protein